MLLNPYRFVVAGGGPADPYWGNVSGLLHMNGADNSTTITDQKGGTWTAYGDAKLRTDISKFGGAALKLDGVGDYIEGPTSSDFEFGSGQFTLEFWFYCEEDLNYSSGVTRRFADKSDGTSENSAWTIQYQPDGRLYFYSYYYFGGYYVAGSFSFETSFTAGNWYHISYSRVGNTLFCFINGVYAGESGYWGNAWLPSTAPVRIGSSGSSGVRGRIDEFRVTKGVGRWNFSTPPSDYTAAYPDS